MEREYIVTAKTKEDLESLYNDLETLGGCECIPSREIECVHRRPISRNTHYYLTDAEAELIKNDSRVLGVELTSKEKGIETTPFYTIESSATEEDIRLVENDPSYTITTSTWSKSTNNSDAHRPWALYRCVNGATVSNWGNNGTQSLSGTVLFTSTGKNVDVVVVDGCFDPANPEFAVNEAGTGGSRVNQFNWFSLNPTVTGGVEKTYLYSNAISYAYTVTNSGASAYSFSGSATGNNPTLNVKQGDTLTFTVNASGHPFWIKTTNTTGTDNGVTTGTITNNGTAVGTVTWNTSGVAPGTYYYICQFHGSMVGTINVASGNGAGNYINGSSIQQSNNNHGCHVAGTVTGNRRGWARDANIYNINPYASAPSGVSDGLLFDYIRAWHNSKAVNATTGYRNPTITNHSYGQSYDMPIADINYVIYRGVQYDNPTAAQCTQFGLVNNGTTVLSIPYPGTVFAADVIDAIDDGIIFVGSAGNSSFKIDDAGGQDYDNRINYNSGGFSYTDYYHRGSAPTHSSGFICVGNIDANVTEEKSTTSNCGPRIDVYAPGSNVVSSVHDNGGGANDSRNANFNIIKYNGTSMASPNVAGVLACLTEQFPRLTQWEAKAYLGAGNIWASYPLSKQSQITDSGANSYTNNRSLQGSRDNYLLSPRVRKVPNPVGTTYIGGETSSQITFPKEHKFRSVKYDINSSFEGDQQYAVDDDIYASGFIYPRRPIWHRSLT